MEGLKTFLDRLRKAAVNLFEAFKRLPIVKPLYALLYSRKVAIASGLTGAMVELFPRLIPVKSELLIVITQLVVIALAWVAVILGIAYEDAAKSRAEAKTEAGTVVLTPLVGQVSDSEVFRGLAQAVG